MHYWKSKKIYSEKTSSWFSLEPFKNAHDTIQCLKNVVHYLNMKIPDIFVEIIELQLLVHSNEMACRKRGSLRAGPQHWYNQSCLIDASYTRKSLF